MLKAKQFYVYILGNYKRNVLYIGVTNNLIKRVFEHKNGFVKGFTCKYKVHDLLYYEIFKDILSAIEREKQLKRWSRKKKNILIAKENPTLQDLYQSLL
jgi:putative endonuclease